MEVDEELYYEYFNYRRYHNDAGEPLTQYDAKRPPGWYITSMSKSGFNFNIRDIEQWCKETLSGAWTVTYNFIYIKEDEELTLFKLVWSDCQ